MTIRSSITEDLTVEGGYELAKETAQSRLDSASPRGASVLCHVT